MTQYKKLEGISFHTRLIFSGKSMSLPLELSPIKGVRPYPKKSDQGGKGADKGHENM